MAVLNFPSNPAFNDTYTENGVTYTWNGTYWQANSGTGLDDFYVKLTGDTMTGGLTLPGGGGTTEALQKQEVEALIAAVPGVTPVWQENAGELAPVTATNNVNIGTGNVLLNADGSAAFPNITLEERGVIASGDYGSAAGSEGGYLWKGNGNGSQLALYSNNTDKGAIYVASSPDELTTKTNKFNVLNDGELRIGNDTTNAGPAGNVNIRLYNDGSADFAGAVRVGDAANYRTSILPGSRIQIGDSSTGECMFQALLNGDAMQVTSSANEEVNSKPALTVVSRTGTVGTPTRKFAVATDGTVSIGGSIDTLPGTPNISLNADGSADFKGSILYGATGYIGDDDLGLLLNGTADGTFGTVIGVDPNRASNPSVARDLVVALNPSGGASREIARFTGTGGNFILGTDPLAPVISLNADGSIRCLGSDPGKIALIPNNRLQIGENSSSSPIPGFNVVKSGGAGSEYYTLGMLSNDESDTNLFINLKSRSVDTDAGTQKFAVRNNGNVETVGDVAIGGTPASPNISLNADGRVDIADGGDLIVRNTTGYLASPFNIVAAQYPLAVLESGVGALAGFKDDGSLRIGFGTSSNIEDSPNITLNANGRIDVKEAIISRRSDGNSVVSSKPAAATGSHFYGINDGVAVVEVAYDGSTAIGGVITGDATRDPAIALNADGSAVFSSALSAATSLGNDKRFAVSGVTGNVYVGQSAGNTTAGVVLGANGVIDATGSIKTTSSIIQAAADPYQGANSGTQMRGGTLVASGTSAVSNLFIGYTTGSSISTVQITADGGAVFKGTVTATVVPPSDARFKENITPANPQLADVVALGKLLKNYNWNTDAPVNDELRATRQLGLIAQEVETVSPGLVKTIHRTKKGKELTPAAFGADGEVTTEAVTEELDDSYKGISQDALIMKLIGAVAELKAEVDALKTP